MANQQMDLTVGQQNLQSGLQTQDLQTKSNLQAKIANQQADLQAQQQAEQSKQYAASLGLQGYGQALEAGRTLGNLGITQQQADLSRLQAQSAVGSQEQQLQQQELDLNYADFLRQRDYPMEQLGYYSNLMRGVPVGLGSTSTTYAPPPSMASQVGGLGLGALGLYNMAKG
jgi:multidrug efflux pump subunit AcrA (membrane-fusion protein)